MRVLPIAALAGLAACNSILGIGEIHVVGDDAGASSGDVHVIGTDLFYNSPTTTVPFKEDLTGYVVQAYVPDASPAGYRTINGVPASDGGFTIPDVPAGTYLLAIIAPDDPSAHFFETASHAIDLGANGRGHPDGRKPTQATSVTFHVTGMDPGQAGDLVFLDSFATGSALDFQGVAMGQTSLDDTFDWRDFGGLLLDAARGDDLFVTHTRRVVDPSSDRSVRTIVDSFSTSAITLLDGQPATVTGEFKPPTGVMNQNGSFDPASYLLDLDYPTHEPLKMLARFRAGFTGVISEGAPLLDISRTVRASTAMIFDGASAPDPFPSDWVRFLFTDPEMTWVYAARGATRTASYTASTFERKPATNVFTMGAPFGAPHGLKVEGVDAGHAAAVPFDGAHPVTIEWAPVVGVSHFIVTAMHLTDDGNAAALAIIATFDTTGNALKMPGALFKTGESYVFAVGGLVNQSIDYTGGIVRRQGFPIAEREVVTARLVFASSCGNGTVDAPFEECDASGAATADCNPDCTRPRCGDGFTNAAAGEACDDVDATPFCNADCSLARCGNGKIEPLRGETCDLGAMNGQSGQCCAADCTIVPPATTCP
ncbi:MAG TPA: hypothetical protein VFT22_37825 [Kofleriaceae bacterium]|nr:hypothetical protein [Kofleriaceae bacterium]